MVKMPDGKNLKNSWSSILVMRNGSTAGDLAWGIRAQTDGRVMVHMTDVSNSANNFNGATLGTGRGASGYFYTPTPSAGGPNIVDGKTVTATTDKPARFEVITARGVVKETTGTDVSWTVEKEAYWQGPGLHVFARVKAYATDGSEEELFSQPFMLTDQA